MCLHSMYASFAFLTSVVFTLHLFSCDCDRCRKSFVPISILFGCNVYILIFCIFYGYATLGVIFHVMVLFNFLCILRKYVKYYNER